MSGDRISDEAYDFVIVGSGAGGGPLAANLALDGFSVCVIEAGGDVTNDHYEVPAFHALATEDPALSWEFFVEHYDNNPERDPKHHPNAKFDGARGILYPRASGLGGCTTHHAMITVYPHDADWDFVADLVDDDSWSARNMRQYFDRFERAQYREQSGLLTLLEPGQAVVRFFRSLFSSDQGEGARGERGPGWLSVTQADPALLSRDLGGALQVVAHAFHVAKTQRKRLDAMIGFNPNHPASQNQEGVNVIPISVDKGKRTGSRERIRRVQRELAHQRRQGNDAGRLDVKLHHFATNVVFDEAEPTRAIGVRCVPGEDLYAARHHTKAAGRAGATVDVKASKEVILAGGAFNTPQMLMLSGIGPADVLRGHGIDVRIDLPGVGRNLQDRYEVGVVARAPGPFKILEEATFAGGSAAADPAYGEWQDTKEGIYATNGAVLGIIKRSKTRRPSDPPDLYIFGVPGYFRGYEVTYSKDASDPANKDKFTWAVLKGHTDNHAGYVTLKSNDPFERPEINFKYFEEGTQPDADDVNSVVDGVKFVMEIYDRCRRTHPSVIEEVLAPVPNEDLHQFVRNNAWGHHASCTCPIGPDPKGAGLKAVLDKDFRVHGAKNLRVVDASVFPRIPGLFILSSVYMISEKASDVIAGAHHPG